MRQDRLPHLIALCGILVLASCAAKPVEIAQPARFTPSCGNAVLYLYFNEGQDTLRVTHQSLADYSDVMPQCQSVLVQVYGLPQPSNDSLEGRRAATVARVLKALGWPEPSFDPGEPEDVEKPTIVLKPIR